MTCHHFGQLSQPDAFDFHVGLVKGTKSSKRIKQLLTAELDLEPTGDAAESIRCSIESRFSPLATCHKGDVIVFKDGLGGFRAGKVQLHCAVLDVPISMVTDFDIHKLEPQCGHSVWTPVGPEHISFVETDQILDTVVYSDMPDGKVAVLLPLDLR